MRIRALPLTAITSLALACGGGSTPTTPGTGAPAPPVPAVCAGTVGATCFGTSNYIEYAPGDLPVVISVPHGGALTPASIPNRTVGTTVTDTNTVELGRALADALRVRTGRTPHLVIVHLRRTKLDANREVVEAAQGNAEATRAWEEYHAFIEQATNAVRQRSGTGVYIDLHGHGHPIARLELGYLLSIDTLNQPDAHLDAIGALASSSLRLMTGATSLSSSALLRGPRSLGGLLEGRVPSVPSPSMPGPGPDPYFNGGYSTSRHTLMLPGLQIESHYTGVRDSAASRTSFSATLADALVTFLSEHLHL